MPVVFFILLIQLSPLPSVDDTNINQSLVSTTLPGIVCTFTDGTDVAVEEDETHTLSWSLSISSPLPGI